MSHPMTATVATESGDAELLRRFRSDRNDGIRGLLARHGGRVRTILRRRYRPTLDTQLTDAALYAAAGRALERFDPRRSQLGPWLLFLADREAVNLLRGERRHRERRVEWNELEPADGQPSPEQLVADAELADVLRDAMTRLLTELERRVIEADLDAADTASATQLAEALETSEQSIYAARGRARAKLLQSPVLKKHFERP
ncbi:MAG: sigma-70 family RNA polymerase sigma factor [Pirellulales bacterium]|nr:sigma-70 family RNA polymerase sigma factor [Pirellulales bacterium]